MNDFQVITGGKETTFFIWEGIIFAICGAFRCLRGRVLEGNICIDFFFF